MNPTPSRRDRIRMEIIDFAGARLLETVGDRAASVKRVDGLLQVLVALAVDGKAARCEEIAGEIKNLFDELHCRVTIISGLEADALRSPGLRGLADLLGVPK